MKFRVKELAQERGLTAEELAQKSGIGHSTILRFYQNKAPDPHYNTLRAIARALGVSVEQLEAEDQAEDEVDSQPIELQAA